MNTTETTEKASMPPPTSEDIIFYTINIGLICLISAVNIIGNTLVIQSVLRYRTLNTPGNYFILSLACSDLVMGIIYPFYNVSHMEISNVLDVLGKFYFVFCILNHFSYSSFSILSQVLNNFR